uniref:SRCR domain-containing protein n=1 Tax=Sphaeramia orbicularis TaxID=375764 RepID=A0A673BAX5_9TELE
MYNGLWGTVCDDGWDIKDVDVVCRAKNCGTALKAKSSAFFGEGQGPIWLDDVNCFGNESSLSHCGRIFFERTGCDHREDAGVVCSGMEDYFLEMFVSVFVFALFTQFISQNALNFNWGMNEATVVCREMNCGDAAQFSGSSSQVEELRGYKVSCTGTESSLTQCTLTEYVRTSSDHMNDASVVCSAPIRLVNGDSECSGRVEIFHEGQWGTVCDDDWGLPDAMVVCRQLGCGHAINAHSGSHFGSGSGPIWLDDVMCGGEELFLTHCRHNGFGNNNCWHHEDAGVTCVEVYLLPCMSGTECKRLQKFTCSKSNMYSIICTCLHIYVNRSDLAITYVLRYLDTSGWLELCSHLGFKKHHQMCLKPSLMIGC